MNEFNLNDYRPDFGEGIALLDGMLALGALTESKHSIIKSSFSILTEAKANTPDVYMYLDRPINLKIFKLIYMDYDTYPDVESLWLGLGYPRSLFEGGKNPEANMAKQLGRIIDHFKKMNPAEAVGFVSLSKRAQAYSKKANAGKTRGPDGTFISTEDEDSPPTRDDINAGKLGVKNRSSAILDRINSQELVGGEFYNDHSRIPPSRWNTWLTFWRREKTSIKQDRSLFGRPWRKTFIIGYEMEKSFTYEVWYNSIDSSFSLHDMRGNQVSRRFPTLNETIKAMIAAIAQSSSHDDTVFRNGINNAIANSMLRSLASGMDQHVDDLMRLDANEQEETVKKREAAEKKRKDAEADREKLRAEAKAKRDQNLNHFKAAIKSGVKAGAVKTAQASKEGASVAYAAMKDVVERFGVPAADAALAKLKSGSIDVVKFTAEVATALSMVGTPAEKDLRGAFLDDEIDLEDYISGMREYSIKIRRERAADQEEAKRRKAETNRRKSEEETLRRVRQEELARTRAREKADRQEKAAKDPAHGMGAFLQRRSTSGTNPQMGFTFEGLLENAEAYDNQEEFVSDVVDSRRYENSIEDIRREVKGAQTQRMLKGLINAESISVYNETRVDRNFPKTNFPRWLNNGRREPIVLPTDKLGTWERLKMAYRGVRYQADFIVGFSLSERVDIEIWYVTEPNPEHSLRKFGAVDDFTSKPTISSFYVFDVSSGKLLRKFIPYYRNAVQIVMAKISAL